MFLRVTHVTRYEYSQPVTFAPHALYLRPRETPRQRLHNFDITLTPVARRTATNDAEDNALDWAHFDPGVRSSTLEFRSEFLVETLDTNPFDFFLKPSALAFPFTYDPAEIFTLGPCFAAPAGTDRSQLRGWLDTHLPSLPVETINLLTTLNHAVRGALSYTRRDEPGIQTPSETLACGSGSCRDYAVFFIALCRQLGLAARFVSGYLYEPPVPGVSNPVLPAMHAWAEVYLPGAGWRGLDPTRGIFCDDSFIPVAHTSLAETVNPIQGGFYSSGHTTSTLNTRLTLDKL